MTEEVISVPSASQIDYRDENLEIEGERWVDVPNSLIKVSDYGRVIGEKGYFLERIIYRRRLVRVRRGVKSSVARLVLEAFVGPSNGLWALHNNGIKTDDRLTNLRWGTAEENCKDRDTHLGGYQVKGDTHPCTVIPDTDIEDMIWLTLNGCKPKQICECYSIGDKYLHSVLKGKMRASASGVGTYYRPFRSSKSKVPKGVYDSIRKDRASNGISYRLLAEKYGVSYSSAYTAVNGGKHG